MLLTGFLYVLKIIGIVLLAILGIALLLILLVLFVPIFYKVDAVVPESGFDAFSDIKKSGVNASARFSWLLFVLRGGIEFPEDCEFYLKVFGIKILPKKKKKEDETEDQKEDKVENKEDKIEEQPEEKTEETASDTTEAREELASETEVTVETAEQESGEQGEAEDHPPDETDNLEEDEEKSFLDVLWNIFDSIDNFLKTPLNVLEKIQYTISRVCDKIDMIKATLENDIFKRAFEVTKKSLLRILRMILPDKCDIRVLLGTGDPAQTAEIMAAYGALYPILFKKVQFQPDFERQVIKADVHLKGHITIFTIVYSAAVCYFNKDVKKTIKRFKKIIQS
jgi:hypothetical protein